MRVYVYAIAKNEAAFAGRWMRSMAEADGVYVLDTGSSDGTAEALTALGAHVTAERVEPWRFDEARNRSLELVPADADILVCTDLDEVLLPGWRAALEKAWTPGCTTARYEYVWSFNADGSDGVKFWYEKVHRPGVCRWVRPVHEVLEYSVPKVCCTVPGMRLEHHPDPAKSRADYLRLLEIAVSETPEDDRSRHYLGREYMYRGMWRQAIDTLQAHLAMPTAVWRPERAASMRYIARCLNALGRAEEAELWLLRAAFEAPGQREPLMDLARLTAAEGRWPECERYCRLALEIRTRDLNYTTEPTAWGAEPWALLARACAAQGQILWAANCARYALALEPENTGFQQELKQIVQMAEDDGEIDR